MSISVSQIMLSAWLFLFWPPSLYLCNFSHNVFSSPLLFASTHALIPLSTPPLYFPSYTIAASHRPSNHPLFSPAVWLLKTFNICFSWFFSTCLWSPHVFSLLSFFPFSNQELTYHLLLIDPNYTVHSVHAALDPHHSWSWEEAHNECRRDTFKEQGNVVWWLTAWPKPEDIHLIFLL